MRFPLARRRSRRRRARRDRTPRRGRSLQGTRGSSVARVERTHRAAVGRSKRPSGAHVVGARGEMPGRDASRGERVRETREERDGASVRGGSVRAARRAHGTSRAVECGKRAVMGSFKRDFLVSPGSCLLPLQSVEVLDGDVRAFVRVSRGVFTSSRAIGARRSRFSCARAPSPPPRTHATLSPPSPPLHTSPLGRFTSQRLRSRAISQIVTGTLSSP